MVVYPSGSRTFLGRWMASLLLKGKTRVLRREMKWVNNRTLPLVLLRSEENNLIPRIHCIILQTRYKSFSATYARNTLRKYVSITKICKVEEGNMKAVRQLSAPSWPGDSRRGIVARICI